MCCRVRLVPHVSTVGVPSEKHAMALPASPGEIRCHESLKFPFERDSDLAAQRKQANGLYHGAAEPQPIQSSWRFLCVLRVFAVKVLSRIQREDAKSAKNPRIRTLSKRRRIYALVRRLRIFTDQKIRVDPLHPRESVCDAESPPMNTLPCFGNALLSAIRDCPPHR